MIKVTLEFVSVDQAIVALGKLAGTGKVQAAAQEAAVSPSPATPRKGRSDKGKARGPQSATGASPVEGDKLQPPGEVTPPVAPEPNAGGTAPVEGATGSKVGDSEGQAEGRPGAGGGTVVTDTGNSGDKPATQPSTPTESSSPSAPQPEKVQAALQKLFETKGAGAAIGLLADFGVKRGRDLPAEKHAEFIAKVEGLLK